MHNKNKNIFIQHKPIFNTLLWVVFYLFFALGAKAQTTTVAGGEYFFDTDLGINGVGTTPFNFSPANNVVTLTPSIVTSGAITPGFHNLHIRLRNSAGVWGVAESRLFYIVNPSAIASTKPIVAAEYFIDTDLGVGAIPENTLTVLPTGDIASFSPVIPTSVALSSGFHNLHIRVKNSDEVWSIAESRSFYITSAQQVVPTTAIVAAEYFFDTDPGIGGVGTTSLNIPTAIPSADISTFTRNITVPVSLTSGFHNLHIRVQNAAGVWSIAEARSFYIGSEQQASPTSVVVDAEYFFDTDPGIGGVGTTSFNIPTPITSADISTFTRSITVPIGLSTGFHNLHIRVKNQDGVWSIAEARSFYIGSAQQVAPTTGLVAAEYFIDVDPGVGAGTAIPPGDVSTFSFSSISTSALSKGAHILHVRVKNAAGVWSIAEARPFTIFNPILTVNQAGVAAYSLRRVCPDYTGPAIRVRKISGTAPFEKDIPFLANGDLDTATLITFVGGVASGKNGFVSVWYDQSGNGRDAVQATAANQPRIVLNGVVDKVNNKPSLFLSGSQTMQTPLTVNQAVGSGALTSVVSVFQSTVKEQSLLSSNSNEYNIHAPWSNSNTYFDIIDAGSGRIDAPLTWTTLSAGSFVRNGNQADVWKNGLNSITDATRSTATSFSETPINLFANGGNYMQGSVSEMLLFNSALTTANRQTIECDEITYFTIPVPPAIAPVAIAPVVKGSTTAELAYTITAGIPKYYSIAWSVAAKTAGFTDIVAATNTLLPANNITITVPALASLAATTTYTGMLYVNNSCGGTSVGYPISVTVVVGANKILGVSSVSAAAFSLRKLSPTYVGSAIRVRRDSDNLEQNIGFDASGNLDTTALTTFVGSGSGYVTTWYDQSGNGRNAVQATETSQPRIVSAGTIDIVNTRPSLFLSGGQTMQTALTVNQAVGSGALTSIMSVFQANNEVNGGLISGNGNEYTIANPWSDRNTYFDILNSGAGRIYGPLTWEGLSTGSFIRNAAQVDIWKNGINSISGGGKQTAASFSSTPINLFAYADSYYMVGTVPEMILYNSALSTANRQTIECNQMGYYKIIGITPSTIDAVVSGVTTAKLPYTAATGSPTTYSISWTGAAPAAGFVNVTGAALSANNITIAVPAGAVAGTSYTGTLTVSSACGTSLPYTITVPVVSPILGSTQPAAAAYSLRKLNPTYAGSAIRVRSSAGGEQNIGFDASGNLDTVALLAFVGAGNDGFVTTWYDQSGNGRNAIQTDTTLQPVIVNSGSIETLNGKPSVKYTNQSLIADDWLAGKLNSDLSMLVVSDNAGTVNRGQDGSGAGWSIGGGGNVVFTAYGAAGYTITTPTISNQNSIVMQQSNTNVVVDYYYAGLGLTTNIGNHTLRGSTLGTLLGAGLGSNSYVNGSQNEVILFATALSTSNRQTIECNQLSYYKILSSITGVPSTTALTTSALGGNTPLTGCTGTWSQSSGPGTTVFSDVNAANATATVSLPGTYTFVWSVSNGNCVGTASISVTLTGIAQTITFSPAKTPTPVKTYGDAPFIVTATASSGLPVVLSLVSGPATFNPATGQVTISGAGTIVLQGFQAGGNSYGQVTDNLSITVNKASASISLASLTQTYNGTPRSVTSTTNPIGLAVTYTYNGSATVPTNAGTYAVVATVNTANYQGTASGTLTIEKATQILTIPPIGNQKYDDPSFDVNATASSGLPVSYSILSTPSGLVSISGSTITMLSNPLGGSVTVTASQAGDSNYLAASDVSTQFNVLPQALYDVELVSLLSPDPAVRCGLAQNPPITIRLKNKGGQTISNFPINLSVNGGANQTENYTGAPLAFGESADFTLVNTPNLANYSTNYSVSVTTDLLNDENATNNNATKIFVRYPLDGTGITADTSICIGDAIVLQTTGGSNTSWNTGDTGNSLSVSPLTTTTYTATITDANGCGTYSKSVTVTVSDIPDFTVTDPPSVCFPSTVNLTSTSVISSTDPSLIYSFYTDSAATIPLLTDPTAVSVGDTYYIKGRNATGCFVIKPVTVVINPKPTVVTVDQTACSPVTTIDLTSPDVTDGSTPGLNYYYYTNAAATDLYSTPTTAVAGTYYIKGVAATGCYDVKSVTVTIYPLPNLQINTPPSVCSPSTVDLSDTSITAGSEIGLTYTYWLDADALSSFASYTTAGSGTYYIKATTTEGCSVTKSVTVTVNSLPNITIHNPTAICSVSSVDLTAASITADSEAGLEYSYYNDDLATDLITDPSAINISGTYYIKGTNPITHCYDIKPVVVVVNTPVTPSFTAVSPICIGGTLSSLPTTSNDGISGSWSPVIDSNLTTTYTFTPNAGECAVPTTMTIVVAPLSVAGTISGVSQVCYNSNTTLMLNGNVGSVVRWESSTDNFVVGITRIANKTNILITANLTVSTQYRAVIKSGNCPFIYTPKFSIKVDSLPILKTANPKAVCSPATINLTAASITSGSNTGLNFSYSYWTDSSASTPCINNTSISVGGTYYIKLTNTTTGCYVIKPVVVKINVPILPVFNPIAPICKGSLLTPLPKKSINGITGIWTPALNNLSTTTYTFTPNIAACALSTTLTIQVDPFTVAGTIRGESMFCVSASTTLRLEGNTGNVLRWESSTNNFSTITTINNTTTSLAITDLRVTTKYRAVIQSGSCYVDYTSKFTIGVYPLPIADLGPDVTILKGDSVTLTANTSPYNSVVWKLNGVELLYDTSIVVSPTVTTIYDVEVTHYLGCTSTYQKTVNVTCNTLTVDAGPDVEIPLGSSTTLTAVTDPSNTFVWQMDGSDIATTPSIVVRPSGTTAYTAMVTNKSGCTSVVDVVVVKTLYKSLELGPTPIIDFGYIATTTTSNKPIYITNKGTLPVVIDGATLVNTSPSAPMAFTIPLPVFPYTLLPGEVLEVLTLDAQFAPIPLLPYSANLILHTDMDVPDFYVSLKGNCEAPIPSWRTVSAVDFGKIEVNTISTRVLTITNNGNIPLDITGVTSSDPAFTPTLSANRIEVNGTISLTIPFSPTAVQNYSGNIVVSTNVVGLENLNISVTGKGYNPGAMPKLTFLSVEPYSDVSGVNPGVGPTGFFTYQVKYSSSVNAAPQIGFPKVGIDRNGDKDYTDLNEGFFSMSQVGSGIDWVGGEVFTFTTNLPIGKLYSYKFIADDINGNSAYLPTDPLYSSSTPGPIVTSDILDLYITAADVKFKTLSPDVVTLNPGLNQSFTISATVHNSSIYPVSNVKISYLIDNVLVDTQIIPVIPAYTDINILHVIAPTAISLPLSYANSGVYTAKVWIDKDNTLGEANILNNVANRPILVGDATSPPIVVTGSWASLSQANDLQTMSIAGHADYPLANGSIPVAGGEASIIVTSPNGDTHTVTATLDKNGNFTGSIDINCSIGANCFPISCGSHVPYVISVTDFSLVGMGSFSYDIPPCPADVSSDVLSESIILDANYGCITENTPFLYEFGVSNLSNIAHTVNGNTISTTYLDATNNKFDFYVDNRLIKTQNIPIIKSADPALPPTKFNGVLINGLTAGPHFFKLKHTYILNGVPHQKIYDKVDEAPVERFGDSLWVLPALHDLKFGFIRKGPDESNPCFGGLINRTLGFRVQDANCSAAGPFKIKIFDINPTDPTRTWNLLTTITGNIPGTPFPGEGSFANFSYSNNNWPVGPRDIKIVLDYDGDVIESDKTNNTAIFQIWVTDDVPYNALEGDELPTIVPKDYKAGTKVRISYGFSNIGTLAETQPMQVVFRMNGQQLGSPVVYNRLALNEGISTTSIDYVCPNDCRLDFSAAVQSLDPNPRPRDCKRHGGTDYIYQDLYTINQCKPASPGVPGEMCPPVLAKVGVRQQFSTHLFNGTETKSMHGDCKAVRDIWLNIIYDNQIVDRVKANDIAGCLWPDGDGQLIQFWCTITKPGEQKIYVQVDPDNTICETDEGNNISSVDVTTFGDLGGNLEVTSAMFSTGTNTPKLGEPIQVSASCVNKGDQQTGDFIMRFYVNDIQLGDDIAITNMMPSDMQTRNATIPYTPVASDFGKGIVFKVILDEDHTSKDVNFNNNDATRFVASPPPFSATIAYPDNPYCGKSGSGLPTMIPYSDDPSTAYLVSGTFSSSPLGLPIDYNTGVIDLAASIPGVYTITYTYTFPGYLYFTTTTSVAIYSAIAPTISYSGSPFCAKGVATVTQVGSVGGIYSAVPAGLNIDTATGTINLVTSTPGAYTVSYDTSGCFTTATADVTIFALPTVTGRTNLCRGDVSQLIGSGSPALTNPWVSSKPLIASVDSSGLVTSHDSGTTEITYTDSNGCSPSTPTTIIVNSLTSVTGKSTICLGETTQLTGSDSPALIDPWVSSDESIATITNSGLVTSFKSGSVNITYTTSNGCSPPIPTLITILPLPTASISGTTRIGSGSTTEITFTGNPNATVTYTVDGGANQTIVLDGTGVNKLTTPILTDSSTYTLQSVSDGTCSKNLSGSAIVSMDPLLAPTITSPSVLKESCSSAIVTGLAATMGLLSGNDLVYQWYEAMPNTSTWSAISDGPNFEGTTTATLSIVSTVGKSGYKYFCRIKENNVANYYAASKPFGLTGTADGGFTWSKTGSGWLAANANITQPKPSLATSIVIDSDYNTSTNGSFDACTVIINSGQTLEITADHYVNIQNNLTINAGGTLRVFDKGSLVMINDAGIVTNNGTIEIHRFTTPFEKYDYTYWSTPVENASIANTFLGWRTINTYEFHPENFVDVAPVDGFDDNGNDWLRPNPMTMKAGRGYIVMVPNPTTGMGPVINTSEVVFRGKVNNGLIEPTVAFTPANTPALLTDNTDDWNLVGNPYPSPISADSFITANAINSNKISGTLYFWTHKANLGSGANLGPDLYNYSQDDYSSYNLSGGVATASTIGSTNAVVNSIPLGKIASGQGFFVEAEANTSLVFNNSMRNKAYANDQFFRKKPKTKDRIWLNLQNSLGMFSQQLVAYIPTTTLGYDKAYDGLLNDGGNYINFYSLIDKDTYKIQSRSSFDQNDQVRLGYFSALAGTFNINIDSKEGIFTKATNIFLEDKLLNVIHDLKNAPYSFATEKGTFNDRFVLRYTDKTLGTNDLKSIENQVLVSINNKQIKVNSFVEPMSKVTIYDLLGKRIYQKENVNNNELVISNLAFSEQALLVKVSLQNGITVTKKIIY